MISWILITSHLLVFGVGFYVAKRYAKSTVNHYHGPDSEQQLQKPTRHKGFVSSRPKTKSKSKLYEIG